MSCRKEFIQKQYVGRTRLKAVCLNYPDTPEEIEAFSRRYCETMIMGLEKQFGDNWGTPAIEKVRELEAQKKLKNN